MKKEMYPIEVKSGENEDIVLTQKWNDINEPNPEIFLAREQAGLVATWIIDELQLSESQNSDEMGIPAEVWSGDIANELEELQVYNNSSGMIIIHINENSYISLSPSMAKRFREQLSRAITISFSEMLKGDEEV